MYNQCTKSSVLRIKYANNFAKCNRHTMLLMYLLSLYAPYMNPSPIITNLPPCKNDCTIEYNSTPIKPIGLEKQGQDKSGKLADI